MQSIFFTYKFKKWRERKDSTPLKYYRTEALEWDLLVSRSIYLHLMRVVIY